MNNLFDINAWRKKLYPVLKQAVVNWTPAYQSYFSAGDEAEPYCENCDEILNCDDEEWTYCPYCGCKLNWDFYRR